MKYVRFTNHNPYKPSILNTKANSFKTVSGNGIFVFVIGGEVERYFNDDNIVKFETLTIEMLFEQFGFDETNMHIIEVDDLDTVTFGTGRYANLESDNWFDYVYLPEAYIEFSEY